MKLPTVKHMHRKKITYVKVFVWLILAAFFGPHRVQAQAIAPATDGTGTVVNSSVNNPGQFNITGGTQSGANLFHSFQKFGLDQGQIANFVSNPQIQNILGRVVGGDASVINGLVQVSGGNSNLYLMNPAGVIFGQNASLNVPGAFTATTANAIGFGDNGYFNAVGNNNYGQLNTNPASFAFTNNQLGSILNAGNLAVEQGQSLTLLGGTVVNTGTISAPGGNITVAAVPGEKLVRISSQGSLLSLDIPQQTLAASSVTTSSPLSLPELLTGGNTGNVTGVAVENGVVKLTNSGTLIPTGTGTTIASGNISASGGKINILGEKVGLVGANIDASGSNGGGTVLVGGDYQGQGTTNAKSTYVSPDSAIAARGLGNANGGKVIVWADDTTRFYGNINARGGNLGGNGGFVETSGKIRLDATGGKVDAGTVSGLAGTWLLDPSDITISNTGTTGSTLPTFDPLGATGTVDAGDIQTVLGNGTNVTITTAGGSGGNGDIVLDAPINAGGSGNLTLTGRYITPNNSSTISIGGNLELNVNQVNNTSTPAAGTIQNAIAAIGNVTGTKTINLGAGTYNEGSTTFIDKSLTLKGLGAGNTRVTGNNSFQVFQVNPGTTATLDGLTIINGRGDDNTGGAITNNGTLTVNNSTLSNNSSTGSGGAIVARGPLTINNSTLNNNSSGFYGGAIFSINTDVTLNNSTVSGNQATGNGGGIYALGGTLAINNSTLTSNNAGSSGGGVAGTSTMTVGNSIIAGNSAVTSGNEIFVTGGTATSNGNNIFGYSDNNGLVNLTPNGTDIVPSVAMSEILSPLGDYGGPTFTHALLPGSVAINAGNPNVNNIRDQRGINRTGRIDIGAFEVAGFGFTPVSGDGQSTTVGTAFTNPLRVQLIETGFNKAITASGISVTFTPPSSGASATGAGTVTTDANGIATQQLSANTVSGSYTVSASSNNFSGTANFNLTNNPDVAANITAIAGGGQSTTVNTNFTNSLQAVIKDQYGNVVPNATVTFNAPTTGASATFNGNTTVTTDSNGRALIGVTANTTAGNYNIAASSSVGSVNFNLINNPDSPASITATAGSGQSTTVNTNFANSLQAVVRDRYGNVVPNASVTFNAPAIGASATFNGNTTLTSDNNGQVSISAKANTIAGNYNVAANSGNATTNFNLINNPDQPATIVSIGGDNQSTTVNTAFGTPLQAEVRDQYGNVVPNTSVTFDRPTTGASANVTGNSTVNTNSQGRVSVAVSANGTPGSYRVNAKTGNLNPANFNLTNNPTSAANIPTNITLTGGNGQNTRVGSNFSSPLAVRVLDQLGNPIAGVAVTFNVPNNGASGIFSNGAASISATTNASGIASVPLVANQIGGNFTATATVAGINTTANFNLTNNPNSITEPIIPSSSTQIRLGRELQGQTKKPQEETPLNSNSVLCVEGDRSSQPNDEYQNLPACLNPQQL